MSAETIVRRAREFDLPAIGEVYVASHRGAVDFMPTIHSDADMRRWVTEFLFTHADIWVVEERGAVVAMMALKGDDELDQLYVDPSHQRRGAGAMLLARAKEILPRRIRLYTFARNAPARAFYEKHGFKAIDFNDGSRNEEHEPDVQYEWTPS